jgi:hypothetical protein
MGTSVFFQVVDSDRPAIFFCPWWLQHPDYYVECSRTIRAVAGIFPRYFRFSGKMWSINNSKAYHVPALEIGREWSISSSPLGYHIFHTSNLRYVWFFCSVSSSWREFTDLHDWSSHDGWTYLSTKMITVLLYYGCGYEKPACRMSSPQRQDDPHQYFGILVSTCSHPGQPGNFL